MPPFPATPPPHADDIAPMVSEILAAHGVLEGPLLPVLHAVHAAFGHLPPQAIDMIARHQARSRAEIEGVVSFHHEFRRAPAGRRVIRLCRAEACQAVGARALGDHARDRLGIDWGGTTADGAVTLEGVYCLGLCACGPAAMVDGRVTGRLTPAGFDQLLAAP